MEVFSIIPKIEIELRFSLLFILLILFFLSLSPAAGQLPSNIIDGNHFWQEITIESATTVNDALFHIWLPFPLNYSGAFASYRFYDVSGNPVPHHVFNITTDASSVSIRADLSAGNNTFYFTGGNPDLGNIGTPNVYDYYNFSALLSDNNAVFPTGSYNFIQLSANRSVLGAGTSQMNFTFSNTSDPLIFHRYNILKPSSGAWSFRYFWNNTASYQMPYNMGDSGTSISSFLVADNINSSGTTINMIGRLNSSSGNLKLSNSTATNLSASMSGYNQMIVSWTNNTAYVDNFMIASGVYTPINVIFSDVLFTDQASGLYVAVIDGADGNILNMSAAGHGQFILGGTLRTYIISANLLQHNLSGNSSNNINAYTSITIDPLSRNLTYTFLDGIFDGMNAVVYIPESEIRRNSAMMLRLNNLALNYSIDVGANMYNVTLTNKVHYIELPAIRRVSDDSNFGGVTGIYGIVVDSRGNAIENVRVTYYIYQNGTLVNMSNSQLGGMFGYSNVLANTMYYLTFEKPGYASNTTVINSGTVNRTVFTGNIIMTQLHNISISVVDESGNTVNSFTAFLGPGQTIRSTDNGTVRYNEVREGETEVIIQAHGISQVTRMINIGEGSTDFILTVTRDTSIEHTTPHFVRFFYRTMTGVPVTGLNVGVYNADGTTRLLNAVTGSDGSVAYQLNQTLQYKFIASNADTTVHEFTVYPKSSEYVIIVGRQIVESPSDVLTNTMFSVREEVSASPISGFMGASTTFSDFTTINVSMISNTSANVRYHIIVYRGTEIYSQRTGSFVGSHTEYFSVERGHVYTTSITFTDPSGQTRTVSRTLDLSGERDAAQVRFSIPGFFEQWHYSVLCVFLVLLTSFSISQKTKRIGGLIIPGEMMLMGYIGWINMTAFVICMMVASVIMSIVYFAEKVGKDEQ
ncbi:MAG: hypothetical protein FWE54_01705 [Methanimicrococcus sp.]|nr:hypothetical protein [Methanimicrococcus sp.]